jgi:hypothetical protein
VCSRSLWVSTTICRPHTQVPYRGSSFNAQWLPAFMPCTIGATFVSLYYPTSLTVHRNKVHLFLQPERNQADTSKALLRILWFLFAIEIILTEIIWLLHYHYAMSCTSYEGLGTLDVLLNRFVTSVTGTPVPGFDVHVCVPTMVPHWLFIWWSVIVSLFKRILLLCSLAPLGSHQSVRRSILCQGSR